MGTRMFFIQIQYIFNDFFVEDVVLCNDPFRLTPYSLSMPCFIVKEREWERKRKIVQIKH